VSLGKLVDRERTARRKRAFAIATSILLGLVVLGVVYGLLERQSRSAVWAQTSEATIEIGHPFEAAPLAVAAIAGSTDWRRFLQSDEIAEPLRDTGLGERALLVARADYSADKHWFARSGKRLLTISYDHDAVLWNVDSGSALLRLARVKDWNASEDETRLII